jgi:DNA-binding NarL/FixJ family response regulator
MKLHILVVGRNPQIMETVLRLINAQENWEAFGALTDEDGWQLIQQHPMDLVLIGGGVDEHSEQFFSTACEEINPAIRVIRHYGGGSGLLFTEIKEAMNLKN